MDTSPWPTPTTALSEFFAVAAQPLDREREIILYRPKNLRGAAVDSANDRLSVSPDGIDSESIVRWAQMHGWPACQVTVQLILRERAEGEARFLKQVTIFPPTPQMAMVGHQGAMWRAESPPKSPVVAQLEKIAARVLESPDMAILAVAQGLQHVGQAWGESVERGRLSAANGARAELEQMIRTEAQKIAKGEPRASASEGPNPTQVVDMLRSFIEQQRKTMEEQNKKIEELTRMVGGRNE
jgi:hypothetical protein